MAKFNLLSTAEKSETQRRFQVYEAHLGFEKAKVFIPLDQVDAFEAAVKASIVKTTTSLEKLVKLFGGEVEQ